MQPGIATIPYSHSELRGICRQLTRIVSEVPLANHVVHVSDIHTDCLAAGTVVREHNHAFYEAHLILHGEGIYATGMRQRIGAGGALLHGPYMLHSWETLDAPCLRLLIWFTAKPAIPVHYPKS